MKIIIYGAGAQGKAAARVLRAQGLKIYAFADREHDKYNAGCDGHRVVSLSELRRMSREDIAVIIGIGAQKIDTLRAIDATLSEWGIAKIYWSAVELIAHLFPDVANRGLLPQAIEVTTKIGCSMRCKACPQDLLVREYGKRLAMQNGNKDYCMTFETFKICFDKFPERPLIGFGGFGEPFENPDCVDMIVYAYKKGCRVAITTTCAGLMIEGVEKLKSEKIVFSDYIPHFPSWQRRESIKITEEYLKTMDAFLEFCASNSTHDMFTENYYSCHGSIHPQVRPIAEKHGFIFNDAPPALNARAGNVDVSWYENQSKPGCLHETNRIVCDRRRNECSGKINKDDLEFYMGIDVGAILLPNGEICLCCMDFGLAHIFGDLTSQSFEDVFSRGRKTLLSNMPTTYPEERPAMCYKCVCAKKMSDYEIIVRKQSFDAGSLS